jgi:hypothetical protein
MEAQGIDLKDTEIQTLLYCSLPRHLARLALYRQALETRGCCQPACCEFGNFGLFTDIGVLRQHHAGWRDLHPAAS